MKALLLGLFSTVALSAHAQSMTPDTSLCGNSVVEAGELCDDGNEVENDGCRRDCTFSKFRPSLYAGVALLSAGVSLNATGLWLAAAHPSDGFKSVFGVMMLVEGIPLDAVALVPLKIYVKKKRNLHPH